MKANSTNILIENCDFYTGLGIAIGSIGQYGECAAPGSDIRNSMTDEARLQTANLRQSRT